MVRMFTLEFHKNPDVPGWPTLSRRTPVFCESEEEAVKMAKTSMQTPFPQLRERGYVLMHVKSYENI